jgi:hypothetical protein
MSEIVLTALQRAYLAQLVHPAFGAVSSPEPWEKQILQRLTELALIEYDDRQATLSPQGRHFLENAQRDDGDTVLYRYRVE